MESEVSYLTPLNFRERGKTVKQRDKSGEQYKGQLWGFREVQCPSEKCAPGLKCKWK